MCGLKRFLFISCISLMKVAYKRQRLKQFAVPTKFNDVPTGKENCEPLDENTKRISNSQINSPGIVQSSVGVMKPSIQENSIVEAVIGYLCKQVLKKYKSCSVCEEAVRLKTSCGSSESQLVEMKSRGGLIHANLHFFHLIRYIEASFAKYSSRVDVFDVTLDKILDSYTFTFPCKEHASEILSYAIVYYLRLRMRQTAHQENLKLKKKFVVKKKLSKLTNE
ncbi:uncharacterized protein LOC105190339 isoform X2 [Harpegnathos saltator]|uniref:uncharacterized protein LOC105190339 isoform X2 n=1 Tax=Harpegnathos saltator TaxID=610380 RepID=UPI000DBED0D3|nr:uncharacterized protein LOC105190339 isoform X2 [Harpegnathos saltator]